MVLRISLTLFHQFSVTKTRQDEFDNRPNVLLRFEKIRRRLTLMYTGKMRTTLSGPLVKASLKLKTYSTMKHNFFSFFQRKTKKTFRPATGKHHIMKKNAFIMPQHKTPETEA